MKIDLDELQECSKCGVIFNYVKCCPEPENWCGEVKFSGKCPVCKTEYEEWETQ